MRLEDVHDPRGGANHRVLLRTAGRKCVRHIGVGHRDLWLGEIGLDAEAFDHRVEAGRLVGRNDLRAHRGQRQLVREEQLGERQRADDDDHRDDSRAGCEQHGDEDHI